MMFYFDHFKNKFVA